MADIDNGGIDRNRYFACLHLVLKELEAGIDFEAVKTKYSITFQGYSNGRIRIGMLLPEGYSSQAYVDKLENKLSRV